MSGRFFDQEGGYNRLYPSNMIGTGSIMGSISGSIVLPFNTNNYGNEWLCPYCKVLSPKSDFRCHACGAPKMK